MTTDLAATEKTANKGQPSGYAPLDSSGLVPVSNLPPAGATPDATTTSKGIVQLAGDLGGTATAPTVTTTHLAAPLPIAQGGTSSSSQNFVDLTTNQTIGGIKTFASSPVVPTSSFPESAVTNLSNDLASKEVTANKGVVNGYASLDGTGKVPSTQLPTFVSNICPTFSYTGSIALYTGDFRWYNDTGGTLTIVSVRASLGTAPTGSAAIFDVLLNGSTIFTTTSNRPTIAASSNTALSGTPNVTALTNGSYLTTTISQVGSTVPGADLSLTVVLS